MLFQKWSLRVLLCIRRANLLPLQHFQNLFNIYQVMTGIDKTNYQICRKSLKWTLNRTTISSFNWFILHCIGLWQHPPAVSGPWSLQPSGRYHQPSLITGIPWYDFYLFCSFRPPVVYSLSLPGRHLSFSELVLNIIKVICTDDFCTDFEWIWVEWGVKVQNPSLIHPYLWSSQLPGVRAASPSWFHSSLTCPSDR